MLFVVAALAVAGLVPREQLIRFIVPGTGLDDAVFLGLAILTLMGMARTYKGQATKYIEFRFAILLLTIWFIMAVARGCS